MITGPMQAPGNIEYVFLAPAGQSSHLHFISRVRQLGERCLTRAEMPGAKKQKIMHLALR